MDELRRPVVRPVLLKTADAFSSHSEGYLQHLLLRDVDGHVEVILHVDESFVPLKGPLYRHRFGVRFEEVTCYPPPFVLRLPLLCNSHTKRVDLHGYLLIFSWQLLHLDSSTLAVAKAVGRLLYPRVGEYPIVADVRLRDPSNYFLSPIEPFDLARSAFINRHLVYVNFPTSDGLGG